MSVRKGFSRLIIAIGAFVAACGGRSGEAPVARLVVTGDMQLGATAAALPRPIVVVALDAKGRALPEQTITFTPDAGAGTIEPPSGLTGADGSIEAQWTLGTSLGDQRASARVAQDGSPTVEQTLTAHGCVHATAAAALTVLSGDGQTVPAYQVTPAGILVGGLDSGGHASQEACDGTYLASDIAFAPSPADDPWSTNDFESQFSVSGMWGGKYYHTPGLHQIMASVAYTPPLLLSINVVANPHSFDGYYECSFVGIYLKDGEFVENIEEYHDIHPGEFDEAGGTFTGNYFKTLDLRDHMTGKFDVDAGGNGTGSGGGTYDEYFDDLYFEGSGTWSCMRN